MPAEWEDDAGYGDDWSGDSYEDGDDEGWGTDDDEAVDTVACGNCGAEVYEEAEQCPHCGEWITHSTAAHTTKPLWWQIIGVLGIIAVILALLQ